MNAVFSRQNDAFTTSQTVHPRHPARRQSVGGHVVTPRGLARFNALLAQLGRGPMDVDALATAARRLTRPQADGRPAGWITRRLRRAVTIGLMAADPAWALPADRAIAADLVSRYLRDRNDLIPDGLPGIGRLDDALIVDAAWPTLVGEVEDYLDYCRIRRTEAELRQCPESAFTFSRDDWAQASRAEKAWIAHCRDASRRSYLPERATPRFRVC